MGVHSNWYIQRDDREYGPIAHREMLLLAGLGKLLPEDRLRAPGFADWNTADAIPGLLRPPLRPSRFDTRLIKPQFWRLAFRHVRRSCWQTWSALASFCKGINLPLLQSNIQLPPLVWCSLAGAVLIVIIGINARTSEKSFAIGAPQARTLAPRAPQPSSRHVENNVAESQHPTLIASTALPRVINASPIKYVVPSQTGVLPLRAQRPDAAPLTLEDSVPLPTRRVKAEPPRRSIDTREGARSIQRRLRDLGYLDEAADGSWGPRSRLALKRFQLRARIASGNGWTRQTERVLFNAAAPRVPVSSSFNSFEQAGSSWTR